MKLPRIFAVIAVVTFALVTAPAGQVKVPDTPVGKRLAEFIRAVATGDKAAHKDFVDNSMSKAFREKFPMEQHLGYLDQVHDNEGSVELDQIEKSSDYDIVVILKGKNGGRLRVELQTEDKKPFGIVGMGLRPIDG